MTPNYKNIFIIVTLLAFAVSGGCDSTSNPSGPDMDMTVSDGGSDMDLGTPDAGPCTEVVLTLGGVAMNGIRVLEEFPKLNIVVYNDTAFDIQIEAVLIANTATALAKYNYNNMQNYVVEDVYTNLTPAFTVSAHQNRMFLENQNGGTTTVTLCYR